MTLLWIHSAFLRGGHEDGVPPMSANASESCVICLEDEPQVRGQLDCCQHVFCYDCVVTWSKQTNKCPVCQRRFSVVDKRAEPGAEVGRKRKRKDKVFVKTKNIGGHTGGGGAGGGGGRHYRRAPAAGHPLNFLGGMNIHALLGNLGVGHLNSLFHDMPGLMGQSFRAQGARGGARARARAAPRTGPGTSQLDPVSLLDSDEEGGAAGGGAGAAAAAEEEDEEAESDGEEAQLQLLQPVQPAASAATAAAAEDDGADSEVEFIEQPASPTGGALEGRRRKRARRDDREVDLTAED